MVVDRNPDDSLVNYNAACLFCKAGDHERALDHLETSLASNMGLYYSGWIDNDSDLDALRDMPRFRKLVEVQPSKNLADQEV